MKKPVHKHHKKNSKMTNYIIYGVLALTVVLIAALAIANAIAPQGEYIVTADGHVHTAGGTHVGDAAEMFGEGYTISEDGHVHAADGSHVATYDGEAVTESTETPAE